ncbi:cytochrome P450 2J4-like isoform X2 [Corythoichthys intestinalis]|uniref:cytochrome P450 2J4-like isoform X2 n=1 Tax=Corythoichthys intestinalis TaxID=161448 RepID=UPI0025A4F9E8|nr:cytochrome P450 2J4-like isoform X2 [Corythoichthys intestinalis]
MPPKSASRKGKQETLDPAPVEDSGTLTLASIAGLLEENRRALSADFKETLAKLEHKLDSINATVTDHSAKIGDLETNATLQDSRLTALEATCAMLSDSNAKLLAKVTDLEARSRRNNIRVLGLPESIEGQLQPTVFFSKMLADVFGGVLNNTPPECDRAHRTFSAKPQPGQRPRPVIIRLHKYQVKDKIIREARAKRGELMFQSYPIAVYEDYPPDIVEQRKEYSEVMSRLYKLGLKPTLLYPARLFIKPKEGGVALSNGYPWKKHRRFVVSHLRYFGEGQQSLENYIRVECGYLCEAFKEEQGKPFNPHFTLTNAVGNVIASVLFGHRFEYNDGNFRRFLELDNDAIVLAGSQIAQLYNVFPSLMKRLPGPHQTVIGNYKEIELFLADEVRKHQEEWNPEQPRDFIDVYLSEIDKLKEDPLAGFNIESLNVSILDLFEAGTESTATTLRWAIVYMMHYPDIQKKVQTEIDNVIGQSRPPALADRPNMHYTEAVIYETQRIGNILPLGFPKMANKEATLGGYIIPKGTAIVTDLASVLFDKNEWETPGMFNPQHFLDSEGHFRRRNAFLPFSAGKRACLGEQLARMELFLFFTALLQRFTFTAVPGEMPSLEAVQGFTQSPKEFRFLAVPR